MQIAKITLYADNQQEAKNWWVEKFGFELILESPMGPEMTWIEVGSKDQNVTLVIYDRKLMQKQNPEFSTESPTLMFTTSNAKEQYDRLEELGVNVFEYMEMPYGTMFKFTDGEDNVFAVRQD